MVPIITHCFRWMASYQSLYYGNVRFNKRYFKLVGFLSDNSSCVHFQQPISAEKRLQSVETRYRLHSDPTVLLQKDKRPSLSYHDLKEDTKGANVVKFFTSSNNMPKACGSFSRLPDDNSSLAVNCDKWGFPNTDRWGHGNMLTDSRLFLRPMTLASVPRFYRLKGPKYQCDDDDDLNPSIGDTWQVFVR